MITTLDALLATIITSILGALGYLFKRQSNRMDRLETQSIKTNLELQKKLGKSEVKEIIDDKIAPMAVTLSEIKLDITEIKEYLKNGKKL